MIEPTIQSQERLDWLSSNILERFRRKQRNIQLTTQGLPHLQIGDPVGITSSAANLNSDGVTYNFDNNEVYYINKINSKYENSNYQSTYSLTSLKPIDSWRSATPITTDVLERIYQANNNTIFANFRQLTINAPSGIYGYDGFSEQAAFLAFDLLIDVDRLWVLISDEENGGELFKYIDVRSKNPIITYQTSNNQNPDQPPQGATWLHNGGGEKWGNIVVPTAQNNFNGGQWAGQNSNSNIRLDGKYPLAIWAQFRTADNATVFQGLWVPPSGTLDNRNRTLSNTSTSSGNIYMQYTGSNRQQALQTVGEFGVTKAYLPAFNVKNSSFIINAWVGPIESGFQVISDNKLAGSTGVYQIFENRYTAYNNPYDNRYSRPGLSVINSNVINTYRPSASYPLVNIPAATVSSGPFNSGIDIVFQGSPSSSYKDIYEDIIDLSVAVNNNTSLQAMSWASQALNYIQKPSYVTSNSPSYLRLPKLGLLPMNGGGQTMVMASGFESIFHEFNPIVVRTNHDFYLTVETSACGNIFGSINPEINPSSLGYREVVLYRSALEEPTRGPIAIYPTNKLITNEYGAAINGYFTAGKNYITYKGPYNVFYPGRVSDKRVLPNESSTGKEIFFITKYIFREAKSNRTFFFVVKWKDPGQSGWPESWLVGSLFANYLRVL